MQKVLNAKYKTVWYWWFLVLAMLTAISSTFLNKYFSKQKNNGNFSRNFTNVDGKFELLVWSVQWACEPQIFAFAFLTRKLSSKAARNLRNFPAKIGMTISEHAWKSTGNCRYQFKVIHSHKRCCWESHWKKSLLL